MYLPAGAKLYKLSKDGEGVVEKYKTMSKPTNVLFVNNSDPYYDVLFEGELWSVPNNDVYPTRRSK